MNEFLRAFSSEGYLALSIGSVENASFYDNANGKLPKIPADKDVYFGVATRKNKGNLKTDVVRTRALWVDADSLQRPLATLPPSAVVMSGHGYHLYWFLRESLEDISLIEYLNQQLAKDVPTADPACWNVNRVLRVPGTLNTKSEPSVEVVLQKFEPELLYTVDDFRILEKLSKSARHKIRTGDTRGFRSRSERDWSIIVDLVEAGATDELITRIFQQQPCGDKVRSDAPPKYLEHTIERARTREPREQGKKETGGGGETGLVEREDGYWMRARRGEKRVSTFILTPKMLLDGSVEEAEDAIVCDVHAQGFTWENITFSRSAFTSVTKLDRECPVAAWQWLGRDDDVRALLPFLIEQLQTNGLPRVRASPVIGLHFQKGSPLFLGTEETLSESQCWKGFEGPLAWLPSKREHPSLSLHTECSPEDLELLRTHLPKLNEPDVVWLMAGWYAAAAFKPWLEAQGYRFPILSVVGTKGSGKTTLIQRIFMPLFGQKDPKSYDAGTTRFVTLAILGSTNAVPVAFSEFRYESAMNFLRYILLSYDTGHDPRGRGDQTTVDYPLMAPFSVDGEDLISDPAARERVVVAHLHPQTVDEGSEAYDAFNTLRSRIPGTFGGFFLQGALKSLSSGDAAERLKRARESVFAAFPKRLPDRVRNNHVVAYFGVLSLCEALGMEEPSPEVLGRSINLVYNTTAGRSRVLVDDLVEDMANACSQGTNGFRWSYDAATGVLYFQLSSAHSWWLSARRRQGRVALERDAIRAQLVEAPYSLPAKVIDGSLMYGLLLSKAQETGLDVPSYLETNTLKVRF